MPLNDSNGPPRPAANAAQLFNLTGPIRSPEIRPSNPSPSDAGEPETTEQRN